MNWGNERLPSRFWNKVSPCPMSGCWLWIGAWSSSGYGQLKIRRSVRPAHRHAYQAMVGAIPVKLELDHLCRVRCCVNPAHLEPVTSTVNKLRGVSPVGVNARKTSCPSGHALSGSNLYLQGGRHRQCRTCNRLKHQQRRTSHVQVKA